MGLGSISESQVKMGLMSKGRSHSRSKVIKNKRSINRPDVKHIIGQKVGQRIKIGYVN